VASTSCSAIPGKRSHHGAPRTCPHALCCSQQVRPDRLTAHAASLTLHPPVLCFAKGCPGFKLLPLAAHQSDSASSGKTHRETAEEKRRLTSVPCVWGDPLRRSALGSSNVGEGVSVSTAAATQLHGGTEGHISAGVMAGGQWIAGFKRKRASSSSSSLAPAAVEELGSPCRTRHRAESITTAASEQGGGGTSSSRLASGGVDANAPRALAPDETPLWTTLLSAEPLLLEDKRFCFERFNYTLHRCMLGADGSPSDAASARRWRVTESLRALRSLPAFRSPENLERACSVISGPMLQVDLMKLVGVQTARDAVVDAVKADFFATMEELGTPQASLRLASCKILMVEYPFGSQELSTVTCHGAAVC
jgi:hypothetical protein